jgi:hypothetical protein
MHGTMGQKTSGLVRLARIAGACALCKNLTAFQDKE